VKAGDMDKKALVFEIVRELKKGNNVALIAFTGWGKTRTALEVAAELAREGYKVGMKFPTLTVAVKKFAELVEILRNANPPPSAILTAGAQQYCAYKWHYPQRYCAKCVLYKNVEAEAPLREMRVLTYQDINTLTPDHLCGYWIQEKLFPGYNIIIGHYGRMSKILPHVHYLVIDEVQELFLPNIKTIALSEIAEALSVDASELTSPDVIEEYAEERLKNADPAREDVIHLLLQMLRSTCWIEDNALNCLELRQMPSGIPSLMLTATPPPGWPPEGWGRKIEIKQPVKPRAFVEPEAKFFYRDGYKGISLQLYYVIRWLKNKFGARCIAVFATSSVRRVLEYTLPMEFGREPPEREEQIPPSGVVVLDAWGRYRVGVDIRWCDAVALPWPSLHIEARRRLRAEGRNPDVAELLLSVQHSGRIMRPRPGETYEDALMKRVVALIDGRFWNYVNYLSQFFSIEELPADIHKI
jgi:hypothetical protein